MTFAASLLHRAIDDVTAEDDARAVSALGRTLSYRELRADSLRFADALNARGLSKGDRVLITAVHDVRLVSLLYAASRLGVVFSVVHRQTPVQVLEHIIADCGPRLFMTGDERAAAIASHAGVPVLSWHELDQHTAVGGWPDRGPIPSDPACLIYTSGTTAMPKAVVSTHSQMTFATQAIQSRLAYRPDDVVYCALPLSFDYGLYQIFLSMGAGAHLVLAPGSDSGPRWLLDLIRERATVLPAVPPLATALLKVLDRIPRRPPLRLLTNTGSAMDRDVLAALRAHLPGMRVQLMFGLTECKRVSILDPDGDLERPDALGTPLPDTEVFTVDESGARLAPGEIGEITVRGGHVMSGYWRRPELTRQRFFLRDGLFPELRTGDFGWLDEDGYLYFAGRRDDIYKYDGFRVSGFEVEAAARRVRGVHSASLLVPTADRPEPVLVVAGDVTADGVLRGLRDELEAFKIPRLCRTVPEIPANANGKTDKKILANTVLGDRAVDRV